MHGGGGHRWLGSSGHELSTPWWNEEWRHGGRAEASATVIGTATTATVAMATMVAIATTAATVTATVTATARDGYHRHVKAEVVARVIRCVTTADTIVIL